MNTPPDDGPAIGPPRTFQRPIWDRGEAIDGDMMAFTIGDDWRQDQRLVQVDLRASIAHANGLLRAELLGPEDHGQIVDGLKALGETYRSGDWTLEAGDEDVHSAVERRLIAAIGQAGKRLHTGRSRNDQVAVDLRLWLRDAIDELQQLGRDLLDGWGRLIAEHGRLPLPGYTHLRRAMPSTLALWAGAHRAALEASLEELWTVRRRIRLCPLGSGAGYGVPLPLDREGVARELGFEGVEEPVTLTQHVRGRAELAYLSVLEAVALDLGKLAADLWLFTTAEFGFAHLPVELTTGSSLMPHKRNPDLLELLRAHARQVLADRAAVVGLLADLPLGYHRDFQLIKPPLFRAHDRMARMLPLVTRTIVHMRWETRTIERAGTDPQLAVTARALQRSVRGETFRDVYRAESQKKT